MIDWSETDLLVRDTIRAFVDKEIRPHVEELEHGDLPPYDLIRKFFTAFGLDAMARDSFDPERAGGGGPGGERAALSLIAVSELSRVCQGLVTAMGVSVGLAAGTIMSRGTPAQRTRWAKDLLTFDKVGAWAITEPDSGSDAFGGMRSTARRDGDAFVLSGQKTFITNGPHADTIVVYAKLDGEVATFVLDAGMPGLTRSKPLRKMGIHSSPTGELFFDDVRLEPDRMLAGGGRESAKANFTTERYGVAAMSLGIIEECLALCVSYAKSRTLRGRPIGDFQLIQLKLAEMEVARLNVQNLVFRTVELLREGRTPTLAEASAMKLYSSKAATDVAMEAVQLFGGNGYMAEYRVEQLARDAKSLMIYAGSNEVQVTHIAKDLLTR
ncbi:MAG: acyl-CoA dehydrogenase [Actinophytocola sp.]|uniref:acyl-CoA dehydrogenase family protein n=1 Tax=Actinophytocola sp. TaxID=1872138 RepID=UPI001320EE71|nr:acyl-CoA dehydrogenase family protein [Actinophytocola sp.]MPZ82429.1 acyl-CoA dehydrogenase [Actinophytocola sp.]